MFHDGTADVTYCADVTHFLHAMSGRLSLTAAFSLPRFLAFYCFKCYLALFSRYITPFLPNIMPYKHTEQDQIDTKWLRKKFVFWRESWRVGRSLIIVNKSIKETENLIFIPLHTKSGWVLCYTLLTLSVLPSVCLSSIPLSVSASFVCSNFCTFWPVFFKLCLDIGIGEEW